MAQISSRITRLSLCPAAHCTHRTCDYCRHNASASVCGYHIVGPDALAKSSRREVRDTESAGRGTQGGSASRFLQDGVRRQCWLIFAGWIGTGRRATRARLPVCLVSGVSTNPREGRHSAGHVSPRSTQQVTSPADCGRTPHVAGAGMFAHGQLSRSPHQLIVGGHHTRPRAGGGAGMSAHGQLGRSPH